MNQQFDHAGACFDTLVGASSITSEARDLRSDDSLTVFSRAEVAIPAQLQNELHTARLTVAGLMARTHSVIEQAERNPDGSDSYCVPAATMAAMSAALAVAGGAA